MKQMDRESTGGIPQYALFVYGTLLNPAIQLRVAGRIFEMAPDTLAGWTRGEIVQDGIAYPNITPSEEGVLEGTVIEVSEAELDLLDAYEGEEYRRIRVTLASGRETWVYTAS